MTNQDPYSDRLTDRDLAGDRLANQDVYGGPARAGQWSMGSIIGTIVAIVVVAAIAYAMNRDPTTATTGPSTTMSPPTSTTGQGGPAAPAIPPTTAR